MVARQTVGATMELVMVTITKGPRDKSWLASVEVDMDKLSKDIAARLAVHGLVQKVADAASASKTYDEALASMQKAVDALMAGEWSSRVAGSGVDEFTSTARSMVKAIFKAKLGAKSPEWAEFTGLSDADQFAKLDALFAKNEKVLRPKVEAELKRKQMEREAKRALSVDFTL